MSSIDVVENSSLVPASSFVASGRRHILQKGASEGYRIAQLSAAAVSTA